MGAAIGIAGEAAAGGGVGEEQAARARAETKPAAPSDQRVETIAMLVPLGLSPNTLHRLDTQSRAVQDKVIIPSSRLFSMGNLTSTRKMTTIVIFGAAVRPDGTPSETLRRRVEAASRHAQGSEWVRFVPTGAAGRYGPSEASVMKDLLMKSGVGIERILMEETGRDTLSSARAILKLSREYEFGTPVMVATSAYHLPRCLAVLCLLGISARPCPPPAEPASARFWKRWYWRLREIPALPYDSGLAIWHRFIG